MMVIVIMMHVIWMIVMYGDDDGVHDFVGRVDYVYDDCDVYDTDCDDDSAVE